jgi:hypothetical protein
MLPSMSCGEPRRLIPFAHFAIAVATTITIFVSWSFFCANGRPVPQYIADSPILSSFASRQVKILEITLIGIGAVNAGELLLDICVYFVRGKYSAGPRVPENDTIQSWNKFLERVSEWAMRLLFVVSILLPPVVLLTVPDDEYVAVYALGFSAVKNTAITAAAAMAVSDVIDRKTDEYMLSVLTTATFAVGEIVYYFSTAYEPSESTQNTLMAGKVLVVASILVLLIRIFKYSYRTLALYWKRGEIRLRKLTMKEWRFSFYAAMFSVIALVVFFLVGLEDFEYRMTKVSDEIVYHSNYIVWGILHALLPIIVARYEASLATVRHNFASII